MAGTMIRIDKKTATRLSKKKKYRRQTYDEIINRLLDIHDKMVKDL